MATSFMNRKDIKTSVLFDDSAYLFSQPIHTVEDCVESIRQHLYWMKKTANFQLLKYMSESKKCDEVCAYFDSNDFTERFCIFSSICKLSEFASVGFLDCLKFCKIKKYKDKQIVLDSAILGGHMHVIRYCVGCAYPMTTYTMSNAVKTGNMRIIQLLVDAKCPMDYHAARCAPNLSCLKLLLGYGCEMDYAMIYNALNRKRYDCADYYLVEYLKTHSVYSEKLVNIIASYGGPKYVLNMYAYDVHVGFDAIKFIIETKQIESFRIIVKFEPEIICNKLRALVKLFEADGFIE
jgi:hypothetical protein